MSIATVKLADGSSARVEFDEYLTDIFKGEWFTALDGQVIRSTAVISYRVVEPGDGLTPPEGELRRLPPVPDDDSDQPTTHTPI